MRSLGRAGAMVVLAAAAVVALVLGGALPLGGPSGSGQFRVYSSNTTASASALTAGRYTVTTLNAALAGANSTIISLGPANANATAPRQRGLEVTFIGVGADNTTGNYRVWQVKRGHSAISDYQPNDMELAYLGSGTFTLSTAVGAASATTVLSTERIADTVTFTQATAATSPKGIGDTVQSAFGATSPAAYSPADNTPGRLWLTDVGNGDVLIELWVGTATSVNAVVDVGT